MDAVVDDSAELFTTGFSTGFGFGGRPLGLPGGFGFATTFEFFGLASSSDSVVLSGEKMLFSFEFEFFEAAAFCATTFVAFALLNRLLLDACNCCCCCCCFTTAGGALPPVTAGGAGVAFGLFDCTGFFASFCTRFVAG